MSLFIKLDPNGTNTKARVLMWHKHYQTLPQEMLDSGIIVDADLPAQPPAEFGKHAVLYYNSDTNALFYEMESRPLTAEEQMQLQDQRLFDLELLLADLLGK